MTRSLDHLILADGPIKDRTTCGDRALWHHCSALTEIVVSMEMLRAAGGTPPKGPEEKRHRAVGPFRARRGRPQRHGPLGEGGARRPLPPRVSDWPSDWWKNLFGGSWMHIDVFRYPDRPEAKWLARAVGARSASAFPDEGAGVAPGCICRTARGE